MSLGNNSVTAPLHFGQVTILFSFWLKQANFFFDGEFVRKYYLHQIAQKIFLEKEIVFFQDPTFALCKNNTSILR
jgi:hypothetical protein